MRLMTGVLFIAGIVEASTPCPPDLAKLVATVAGARRYVTKLDEGGFPGKYRASLYGDHDDVVFGTDTVEQRKNNANFIFKVHFEGVTQRAGDATFMVTVKKAFCEAVSTKMIAAE